MIQIELVQPYTYDFNNIFPECRGIYQIPVKTQAFSDLVYSPLNVVHRQCEREFLER